MPASAGFAKIWTLTPFDSSTNCNPISLTALRRTIVAGIPNLGTRSKLTGARDIETSGLGWAVTVASNCISASGVTLGNVNNARMGVPENMRFVAARMDAGVSRPFILVNTSRATSGLATVSRMLTASIKSSAS